VIDVFLLEVQPVVLFLNLELGQPELELELGQQDRRQQTVQFDTNYKQDEAQN